MCSMPNKKNCIFRIFLLFQVFMSKLLFITSLCIHTLLPPPSRLSASTMRPAAGKVSAPRGRDQSKARVWTTVGRRWRSCATAWTPRSLPGKVQLQTHEGMFDHIHTAALQHLSCLCYQQTCSTGGKPRELRRAHQQ